MIFQTLMSSPIIIAIFIQIINSKLPKACQSLGAVGHLSSVPYIIVDVSFLKLCDIGYCYKTAHSIAQ